MVVSAPDDGGDDEGKDDIVIVCLDVEGSVTASHSRRYGRRERIEESWMKFQTLAKIYKNIVFIVDKGFFGKDVRWNFTVSNIFSYQC